MDFEAEPGDADNFMAPVEDLLGYDDDETLEEGADVYGAQEDPLTQQAASEEEGSFRCVTKTTVLADRKVALCSLLWQQISCSSKSSGLTGYTATQTQLDHQLAAEAVLQLSIKAHLS